MALTQLAPPYPIFTDKSGSPLDAGYLYFGEVNKNPETNPIQVYYDSAFTQPAAQPLRTSNGYVMRNGSPALIYAGSQFSVTVRDKNNVLVIYSPVGYGIDPGSVTGTVVYDDFTGDGTTVSFTLSASPSTKNATNVYIDGVYQSKDNYNTSGSTLTFSTAPPLNSAIEVVSQESSIIGGASSQQITYTQGGAGSVTRTVQSRLRDFVSVKDFGAVGDGVTDDTAAFVASQASTDYVFVPDGTYSVDESQVTLYNLHGPGKLKYQSDSSENWVGLQSKGTVYIRNDEEVSPGIPLVPAAGLLNIADGQLKFWPDLDGDGDYDADIWANSNFYLAASGRTHIRSNIPSSGGAGDDEGRLVIGATDTTNYIQSAKNFSGSVKKDFAIGDYNSTDWWMYFDESNDGHCAIGVSNDTPLARLHVADTAATVALFESEVETTARIGFRGTSQSGNTIATVGVDTVDRLVLRGEGEDVIKIGATAVQAGTDNTYSMGSGTFRWSTVFAATGTINTSDKNDKQDIALLDEAELRVATTLKGLIKKFRFRDAVAIKGDNARIHVGVIAQEVEAAFAAEGLNGFSYGVLCYDKWDEELDGDGSVAVSSGERYGVRYEELFSFVIAAL
jgi:hypothetical protein